MEKGNVEFTVIDEDTRAAIEHALIVVNPEAEEDVLVWTNSVGVGRVEGLEVGELHSFSIWARDYWRKRGNFTVYEPVGDTPQTTIRKVALKRRE